MTEAGIARPTILEALWKATTNWGPCHNPHHVAETLREF